MDDKEFNFGNAETIIRTDDEQHFILFIKTAICLNKQNLNKSCKRVYCFDIRNLEDHIRTT
jgi:hypothetical protein